MAQSHRLRLSTQNDDDIGHRSDLRGLPSHRQDPVSTVPTEQVAHPGVLGVSGWPGGASNWITFSSIVSTPTGPIRPYPWIRDNMGLVIMLAVLVFAALVAMIVLLLWLSSRSRFMFLDGIVRNGGAVVAPWRNLQRQANSLFAFRICLALAANHRAASAAPESTPVGPQRLIDAHAASR